MRVKIAIPAELASLVHTVRRADLSAKENTSQAPAEGWGRKGGGGGKKKEILGLKRKVPDTIRPRPDEREVGRRPRPLQVFEGVVLDAVFGGEFRPGLAHLRALRPVEEREGEAQLRVRSVSRVHEVSDLAGWRMMEIKRGTDPLGLSGKVISVYFDASSVGWFQSRPYQEARTGQKRAQLKR